MKTTGSEIYSLPPGEKIPMSNTTISPNPAGNSHPHVTRLADVEPIAAFGDRIWQLIHAEQTNGLVEVGLDETQPGGGPPFHLHTLEDELFWILEGNFEFTVGQSTRTVTPGSFIFAPRRVPHTFRCTSETPGRLIVIAAPGNFGTFFRRCSAEFATGAPDFGRIIAISAEHGITYPSPEEAAAYSPPADALQPKIVLPEEGEVLEMAGHRVKILLSAEETGEVYGLVHLQTPAGFGPPLHLHSREDELFLIQKGVYEFRLNEEAVRVGPGDVVWGPRPFPHNFRVVSEEPGQMLSLLMPGGFEQYFRRIQAEVQKQGFTPALAGRLQSEFGVDTLA
jgi:mannose-6-phosphate isomerase-like protein (cupin superfamily)